MNSSKQIDVGEATENLSEKTVEIAAQTSDWVSGNALDILIATAIGLGLALLMLAVRSLGCRLVGRGEDAGGWRTLFARVIAKTSVFFIVMCSAVLVAEHADTPDALLGVINFLFVFAAAFQAAMWARELILGFIQHRAGTDDPQGTLGSAFGIIRLLVTVTLFAIAIILILDNLGVNVTGLVAGLGIGGIAIGLAAQGIFSDLFAALSIIFDKPFRKGDTITFDTVTGTVEQIGLKSTRIRSLSGEEVVISNANLLNTRIQNWAHLQRRRIVMLVGVVYQTPPDVLVRLGSELQAIVDGVERATFDRAHVAGFAASSIDVELVFHVESADYAEFMEAKQGIMIAILKRFAKLGVEFAYPTQTTFTAAPDGKLVMPYPHVAMLATPDPN